MRWDLPIYLNQVSQYIRKHGWHQCFVFQVVLWSPFWGTVHELSLRLMTNGCLHALNMELNALKLNDVDNHEIDCGIPPKS